MHSGARRLRSRTWRWPPTRARRRTSSSPAYLASALAIHSVEARHAAWIRRLAGKPPVAGPFDEPLTRAAATRIVARTHFVMRRTSRKGPKFTG